MSGGCFVYFSLGSSCLRMLPSMAHPTEHSNVRLEDPSAELRTLCFLLVSMLLYIVLGGVLLFIFFCMFLILTILICLNCLNQRAGFSVLTVQHLKNQLLENYSWYYSLIALVCTILDVHETIISYLQFRVNEVGWVLVLDIRKRWGAKEVLMLSLIISGMF